MLIYMAKSEITTQCSLDSTESFPRNTKQHWGIHTIQNSTNALIDSGQRYSGIDPETLVIITSEGT